MSAFVVTETGVVVEYPKAGLISWESTENYIAVLYEREGDDGKGRGFVAKVPRGCLVSFSRPGVVKQAPEARRMTLEDSLEIVVACIDSIPASWPNTKRLKALKAKLALFDARRGCWK